MNMPTVRIRHPGQHEEMSLVFSNINTVFPSGQEIIWIGLSAFELNTIVITVGDSIEALREGDDLHLQIKSPERSFL